MSLRTALVNAQGERMNLLETQNLVFSSLEEDVRLSDPVAARNGLGLDYVPPRRTADAAAGSGAEAAAAAAGGGRDGGSGAIDFSSAGLPVLIVSYFKLDTDPSDPNPAYPTPLVQRPHVRSHFVPHVETDHSLWAQIGRAHV